MISYKINVGFVPEKSYLIGVFTDYDNMEIGLNNIGLHFDYGIVLTYLEGFGNIEVSNVYGDWDYCKIAAEKLSSFNLSLKQTIIQKNNAEKKNFTDSQMIIDIYETLVKSPKINLFAICSGDYDFIPVIEKIKNESDKKVFIIAEKYSLNQTYIKTPKIVDKAITYQELLKLFQI